MADGFEMNKDERDRLSHFMSKHLRHNPTGKLRMDAEGYAFVDELLAMYDAGGARVTLADVQLVVITNSKQRFKLLEDGRARIRANQGHSASVGVLLDDESMLKPLAPGDPGSEVAVHGTSLDAWEIISKDGLRPMSRKHVHLASDRGRVRGGSHVLIFVDIAKAEAAGAKFFVSSNGVILTESHIPASAFRSFEVVGGKPNPQRRRGGAGRGTKGKNPDVPVASRPLPEADIYVALDFEATCEDESVESEFQVGKQEIIEFPMVAIDSRTLENVGEFRSYVRPTLQPRLTAFCTKLTGIEQATVDAAPAFPEVWERACAFVTGLRARNGGSRVLLVTCGNWDLLTALPRQLGLVGLAARQIPAEFLRWVNVKDSTVNLLGGKTRGMASVLSRFGLQFEGRPHSGLDDARNVARVVRELLRRGSPLGPTGFVHLDPHS